MNADGPYCPIPQPDEFSAYIHEIYPASWALVEENGVAREATAEEIAELSERYSPELSGSFLHG